MNKREKALVQAVKVISENHDAMLTEVSNDLYSNFHRNSRELDFETAVNNASEANEYTNEVIDNIVGAFWRYYRLFAPCFFEYFQKNCWQIEKDYLLKELKIPQDHIDDKNYSLSNVLTVKDIAKYLADKLSEKVLLYFN